MACLRGLTLNHSHSIENSTLADSGTLPALSLSLSTEPFPGLRGQRPVDIRLRASAPTFAGVQALATTGQATGRTSRASCANWPPRRSGAVKSPLLVFRKRRPSSACPPKQAKREGGSTGRRSDYDYGDDYGLRLGTTRTHTPTLPYSHTPILTHSPNPQPPNPPTPKGGPCL